MRTRVDYVSILPTIIRCPVERESLASAEVAKSGQVLGATK